MLRTRLDISLWIVQTAPYTALDIRSAVRPYWIVSHILEGSVVTETHGERYVAYAGDVMVHPPHLSFSEQATGPGIHQWIGFDAATSGEGASIELFSRFPIPPVVSLGNRRSTFLANFEDLEKSWQTSPETPLAEIRTAVQGVSLLSEIIAAWEESGSPVRPESFRQPSERFASLVAYMQTHLSEHLTREDLARQVFMHPGSLDRAFRIAYGTPPLRMLQDMRLAYVRHRLETSNDTLDAIAYACGLGDATRLSRAFRARFGVAPGVYRREAQGQSAPLYPESKA